MDVGRYLGPKWQSKGQDICFIFTILLVGDGIMLKIVWKLVWLIITLFELYCFQYQHTFSSLHYVHVRSNAHSDNLWQSFTCLNKVHNTLTCILSARENFKTELGVESIIKQKFFKNLNLCMPTKPWGQENQSALCYCCQCQQRNVTTRSRHTLKLPLDW